MERKEKKNNAPRGWVCPLCGRVNSPWKETCDCFKDEYKLPDMSMRLLYGVGIKNLY